jgi:protoporphyrinogen oxidase
MPQHTRQVKVGTKLLRHKREHQASKRPPRQQVRAGLLQFPGARSEKHEAEAVVFREPVHLVQQGGKALDFVDNHPCTVGNCQELATEQPRVA